MIHIVCWKWRGSGGYAARHVNVLAGMVARHFPHPHRFVCVTDDPRGIEHETHPLWADHGGLPNPTGPSYPSCYRRLKLFDPATQAAMGIAPGDSVVSLDLDLVIVGYLGPLLLRSADFIGWRIPGKVHESVINGSLFMLRAGAHADVWRDFDAARSPALARAAGFFGSDQAWLSYKISSKVAAWGPESGIVNYMTDMVFDARLPAGARIVSFNGRRKPWDEEVQREAPWIAEHWRA